MTDGYGNDDIHIYTLDGTYTGHTVGGKGTEHGKFNTPHSISWDPRRSQMVVSDRANHRLEYFEIDAKDPTKFDYVSTTMQDFAAPNTGLVCNARFLNDSHVITPTLEGYVFIMDKDNKLVSTVDVNGLLGAKGTKQGFDHPHDAIFLPNGDFVVATWNPGRIGYFKKL